MRQVSDLNPDFDIVPYLFMLSVTFYCYLEFRVKKHHAHDYTTGLLCTTWSELSNSCSSIL